MNDYLDELRERAKDGDVEATYKLGMCYRQGTHGVGIDVDEASIWLSRAANKGHTLAAFEMGKIFMDKKDEAFQSVAARWFNQAANGGCDTAIRYLKTFFDYDINEETDEVDDTDEDFEEDEDDESYISDLNKEMRERAEDGDMEAVYNLGMNYLLGSGVQKDENVAAYWLEKSANEGYVLAAFEMGKILMNKNSAEDREMAFTWFAQAAEGGCDEAYDYLREYFKSDEADETDDEAENIYYFNSLRERAKRGDTQAAYELGMCCLEGKNGARWDENEAVAWLTWAGNQGHAQAALEVGKVFEHKSGEEFRRAAFQWFCVSANNGCAIAYKYIGDCYFVGDGVEYNVPKAIECYEYAASRGNGTIECEIKRDLGNFFYNGEIVEQNYQKAVYWYNEFLKNVDPDVMRQNPKANSEVQTNLGVCMLEGLGTQRDYSRAFELFSAAAQKDYPEAVMNLGKCYMLGINTGADRNIARQYFIKASNLGCTEATELIYMC